MGMFAGMEGERTYRKTGMEGELTFRKTRIAPTPSGFLHLGNVLSFVRTVGMARDKGAKILLRIDDMDRVRVETEYVQDIFDVLNFLELPWEEGPGDVKEFEREWSQAHRMGMYRDALEELKEKGAVFACSCSRAKVMRDSPEGVYAGTCRDKGLSFDSGDVSWRLRTGEEEVDIRMVSGGSVGAGLPEGGVGPGVSERLDRVLGPGVSEGLDRVLGRGVSEGFVRAKVPAEMKDFVVRKRDGFPAYQLSSVVDDLFFGVDLVVRGEDLWASTVAQHYLAGKLGREFGEIGFYHHALLSAEGGRKLSKSAGDTSIQYLRKQGWKKKDVYTMIAGMMGVVGEPTDWEELWRLMGAGRNGKG